MKKFVTNGLNLERSCGLFLEQIKEAPQRTLPKPYGFYWSKKSIDIAAMIYSAFTKENDVICDPFLGSGSALYGISALKGSRVFIGVELNEMPLKTIALNLQGFSSLKTINEMLLKLETFITKTQAAYQYPCFQCGGQFIFITALVDLEPEYSPLELNFECPRCGSVKLTNKDVKNFKKYSEMYLARQASFQKKNKRLENPVLLKNSRIAVRDSMRISDLFSPVNFNLLNAYRKAFSAEDAMLVLLSGGLQLCKFTDKKSQSQFPYWYPKKLALDRNVHIVLRKKLKSLKDSKGFDYGIKQYEALDEAVQAQEKACVLFHDSVIKLRESELPNQSVDLIFTDPPYYDQVAYSEYLKLWEYFTGYQSNLKDEIIESQREGAELNRQNYLEQLNQAFCRIRKFMKKDGLLIVYFKDSKIKNMSDFLRVMKASGFDFKKQMHIPKNTYTYKQNSTPQGTVEGDCLLFFSPLGIKDSVLAAPHHRIPDDDGQEFVRTYLAAYLGEHGPTSLGKLIDDGLLVSLYQRDLLDKIDNTTISQVLNEHFDWDASERVYDLKKEIVNQ